MVLSGHVIGPSVRHTRGSVSVDPVGGSSRPRSV